MINKKVVIFFILFFMLLILSPVYYLYNDLNSNVFKFFVFTYIMSIVSINLGWHRYYTHNMFKLNSILRFLFLFFGSSVFFGKISDWTIEHLNHHKYFGTDKDPMNSNKGFFHQAYWMVFKAENCSINKVHETDVIFNFFNNHWISMTLVSNLVLIFCSYLLSQDLIQSVIWIFIIRINLVFHLYTITHALGHANLDKYLHIFNGGEGIHESHHKKPNSNMEGNNITYLFFIILKKINFIKEKNE